MSRKRLLESSVAATALAVAVAPALSAIGFYQWQARPTASDGYTSALMPQPVCVLDNGVARILVFSANTQYTSGPNPQGSVRVGAITVGADNFTLLAPTLPGPRWGFAAAALTTGGNSTAYIFGGRNTTGEFDEVYSVAPNGTFTSFGNIPAFGTIPGQRSGAVAVAAYGKIYLLGGQRGNSILSQVLEFDPSAPPGQQFKQKNPLPLPFTGLRAMTKGVGTRNYIYLVNGGDRIYRYDPQDGPAPGGVTVELKDFNQPTSPLRIPPNFGTPMISWDPSGNIKLIAPQRLGNTPQWANFHAWTLQDSYPSGPAKLLTSVYNAPARARNDAGAVKCGPGTYLIGGTYGHGSTYQNRSQLVDKLGDLPMKGDFSISTSGIKAQ